MFETKGSTTAKTSACSHEVGERTMPKADLAGPDWLALRKKIRVAEAAKLCDLSEDSFRRHYRHLIHKITPRRDVVTLADALNVGSAQKATVTR
jgi:hypothetical protein